MAGRAAAAGNPGQPIGMTATQAWLEPREEGDAFVLALGGAWGVDNLAAIDDELRRLHPGKRRCSIDITEVSRLDTAGAWAIWRTRQNWQSDGATVEIVGVTDDHQVLLDAVGKQHMEAQRPPRAPNAFIEMLVHLGEVTVDIAKEAADLLAFLGQITVALGRHALNPGRLRAKSLVFHMQEAGLNAIPIVGLMSFLIGIVLAFQGASQLQRFGAEVFVVNLVAISVLREIGVLMTAIIVAGRSGSAFTAQIGSMKVNEEIDAMRALGLDPIEVLVLPRLLALVITLPLLAFVADLLGLLGGGLMAWMVLGISPGTFIERLNDAIGQWTFWVGIIKAPVFAFTIAMIGCYEGLQVGGSAESVGQRTTRAVVEAIFLVIVIDAVFSVFYQLVGI